MLLFAGKPGGRALSPGLPGKKETGSVRKTEPATYFVVCLPHPVLSTGHIAGDNNKNQRKQSQKGQNSQIHGNQGNKNGHRNSDAQNNGDHERHRRSKSRGAGSVACSSHFVIRKIHVCPSFLEVLKS